MRQTQQRQQLKKLIMMMRIVFYSQFAVVAVVVLYLSVRFLMEGSMPDFITYLGLLGLLIVMVILNGYFLMRDRNLFMDLSDRISQQDVSYENVKELNRTLRAQRHDFLNHIQVLYTLMELGEHEETRNYLDDLYEDVGKLSARIKTKSVAVNALMQAKSNEAESLGINFDVSLKTRFDRFIIPDWEVCRIFANVIDNAFEASKPVDEPRVVLELSEKVKTYELTVSNDAMPVGDDVLNHLFDAGFTTKKDKEGHGMGMNIVKKLVEKYSGEIEATYSAGRFHVNVMIPKSVEEPEG